MLDQLFSAAVQEADMGVNALNDLAVKLKHKAKHTVSCGVLGPEVEGEIADSGFHGALCLLLRQRGARIRSSKRVPFRIAAAPKPDGIDFVGNSKISSF
jgi:hypothetical protein